MLASAYGRSVIIGADPERDPEYYAVGAPSCHSGNFDCILPDYDDPTAFYQCVSGCSVAVKQYCASCLHFDFWQQRCEWPGQEGAHPPAPALCSMLNGTIPTTQSTTSGFTTASSEGPTEPITTDDPGEITNTEPPSSPNPTDPPSSPDPTDPTETTDPEETTTPDEPTETTTPADPTVNISQRTTFFANFNNIFHFQTSTTTAAPTPDPTIPTVSLFHFL